MKGKVVYIIIVLIALALGAWFLFKPSQKPETAQGSTLLYKAQNSSDEMVTSDQGTGVTSLSASLSKSERSWSKGESYKFRVEFDKIVEPYPTAMTLIFNYDPSVLQIDDIEVGDLWTGANILEDKVDNDAGSARFSAGQDFDAEVADGTVLAVVSATVLDDASSGETLLKLDPKSAIASEKDIRLIYLTSEPLSVSIQ